ncbi:LytR/AlgR family response regulator transcription factor [Flavilitoribacter nigricans]|uniref:DNA-binding response regulator n=1 Tax=Flavilitoribacter nigricans (strain ATCC 23147 / DSM 23189 / NBRC 102662 / NCIMB 1420 / SS-2) TaxID=1122177 RepID=A0A2D0N5B2_FLAN2|nr:LytTR family DNA-binding domain-containing protein [Flavilitoribacter nigricans]PHN02963.1 DNA-binding response regulator [Flavilitoribacter nigricans DSM 23189 = NBRC 102662]
MKILLVEDELPARERLKNLLAKMKTKISTVAEAGSIQEAVLRLEEENDFDLAFFDIQLSDGLSFEIFRKVNVRIPVIFTTAYDAYLLEAFHSNGIDYLLKPLKERELFRALQKFYQLQSHFSADIAGFIAQMTEKTNYLKRIAGMKSSAMIPVKVEEVAWFTTRHKVTLLRTFGDESLVVNKPLTNLEGVLDPHQFRRVNRQYIVNIEAVRQIKPYQKGKLLLSLEPSSGEEIVISQEQASLMKEWLEI